MSVFLEQHSARAALPRQIAYDTFRHGCFVKTERCVIVQREQSSFGAIQEPGLSYRRTRILALKRFGRG
jgi:hypothetical protein